MNSLSDEDWDGRHWRLPWYGMATTNAVKVNKVFILKINSFESYQSKLFPLHFKFPER